MPIQGKKVDIELISAQPTVLTPENLQNQLNNIGLTCEHTNPDQLKTYISDVITSLPRGSTETWGIQQHKQSNGGQALYNSEFSASTEVLIYGGLEKSADGNWETSGSALGYATDLEYIQFPTHFDYLLQNKTSFTGIKDNPPAYTGRYDNVDAIKSLFINVGITASATLVKGLNQDSIQAVLSNAISPLTDSNASNYDVADSRVIFLVENYNPATNQADAIGVLTINWHLVITDYKEKKKSLKHDVNLTISSRSVLYDDINALNADIAFVKSHFQGNLFLFGIPPKPTQLEIFTALPPANSDTFNKSLPKISKEGFTEAIVLYAPDLDNIGTLDNSNSDATTTYSKSVTSGFTFTTTQSLSTTFSFEATVEVVKAGFTIGLTITFSEQWSKTTTETMAFTVPAGKKAFTYQGYLRASILRFDASSGNYKYTETSRFLTNILTTTRTPIESPS